MKKQLEEARNKLNRIDRSIIELLADRREVVGRISEIKAENEGPLRDSDREEDVLNRVSGIAREAGLDPHFVEELYLDIIRHSVRHQTHAMTDSRNRLDRRERISVAYQGTEGAFSQYAAQSHYEERYGKVACFGYDTFAQAADSVVNGRNDVAMLPVENTTAGSINETYDLLGTRDLQIVGEEIIRVVHCLMAIENVPLERIRRIFSHPQAIAQCSNFLAGLHRCQVQSYIDTAMAAKKVVEDGDLSQAAIAGAHAAELYGLQILERGIANQQQNYTRFVIVAADGISCDPRVPCKTSLLLTTDHRQGELLQYLNILDEQDINMTKLESRPRPGEPWKYQFYIDIEGNAADPRIGNAIEAMRAKKGNVRMLGSYPSHPERGGLCS